tara:strand:+ start:1315 stop:1512 length:198 start_codon:yes stop_codon:yes gene_type:complete
MFYYLSVISYMTLAPYNIPVIEKSVTGHFPDKHLCEIYKNQVEELVYNIDNAKIISSKCIQKIEA